MILIVKRRCLRVDLAELGNLCILNNLEGRRESVMGFGLSCYSPYRKIYLRILVIKISALAKIAIAQETPAQTQMHFD